MEIPRLTRHLLPLMCLGILIGLIPKLAGAAATTTKYTKKKATVARLPAATKSPRATPGATRKPTRRKRRVYRKWSEPTYADSTLGDNIEGEDLEVRRAAVEALGAYNGSVVVVDPSTGRVLSIVNQRVALSSGFQPCSTIKVPVALAGLSEGLIDRSTKIRLYGRTRMNLTEALAKSNNPYFARLGEQLGYERVAYYAHLFGLGEKASLDIPTEQPGYFPAEAPKNGGMGMLCSFGEEILLTPLQLAAFMSALANGGTLYYLQYPRNQEEIQNFVPRIKRKLDIEQYIPEVKPGLLGAAQYGTARRVSSITGDPIVGKTGTCSENRTHLGWFGSFNDSSDRKLVVVVLLTGGGPSAGPTAAGVAGSIYRLLAEKNYAAASRPPSPAALIGTQTCCGQ